MLFFSNNYFLHPVNALMVQRSGVGKVLYITHSGDTNLNWVPTKHAIKTANCMGIA